MRPRADSLDEARRWILAAAFERLGGRTGERLGTGVGSSLEIQDRRAYVAGDDVRHVDWRAFGRTDQLLVRQYREEILPRVELLCDASASMAVEPDKAALAVEVPLLLAHAARNAGAEVVPLVLAERPRRASLEELEREGIDLAGRRGLAETLRETGGLVGGRTLRVLVSDLLAPLDPEALVRRLGDGAGALWVVQVLGRDDVDPPVDAALRLEDAETGGALDVVVDAGLRARYLARLERLTEGVRSAVERRGGRFVRVVGSSLGEVARDVLAPAGLVSRA